MSQTPSTGARSDPARRDASLRRFFFLVLFGVIAFYLIEIVVPLMRTTNLADDYRQHFLWLVQVHDGFVFHDDPLTQYSRDFQPPAFARFYEFLARSVDPYPFTKWVSIALIGAFAGFCFLIGEQLAPRTAVAPLLCSLVLLDQMWTREVIGAFPRSYGPPLQAGLIWAVLARKRIVALVLLVASGLVHPQSMILGTTLLGADLVVDVCRQRRFPLGRREIAVGLIGVVAIGLLAMISFRHLSALERKYGRLLTRAEVLSIPEYAAGGRWQNEHPNLLPIEAARMLGQHFNAFGTISPSGPLRKQATRAIRILAALLIPLEVIRRLSGVRLRDIPRIIPLMIVIGCLWSVVAHLMLPRLYFPRRYVTTYLPLAFDMALMLFLGHWIIRLRQRASRWAWVAPAVVLALFAPFAVQLAGQPLPAYRAETEPYRGLASFICSQPASVTYAARPSEIADTLTIVAARPVYIAREISHALFTGYLDKVVRPRTRVVLRAMFPEDPARDVEALRNEGVDLLIFTKSDLGAEQITQKFADEPFFTELRRYWSPDRRRQREEFWSLHGDALVYHDQDFTVYDLRKVSPR